MIGDSASPRVNYTIITTLLTLLSVAGLLSLRLVGLFVVLAHLRHGTVQVSEGDLVREGDPLALLGNSGNTTMPHLHLQVQTHVDLWDPDNRSVLFAFEAVGHILARNDRVEGRDRS